jgi:hypothetical protein
MQKHVKVPLPEDIYFPCAGIVLMDVIGIRGLVVKPLLPVGI